MGRRIRRTIPALFIIHVECIKSLSHVSTRAEKQRKFWLPGSRSQVGRPPGSRLRIASRLADITHWLGRRVEPAAVSRGHTTRGGHCSGRGQTGCSMDVWQHGPWQWFVLVVKALWVFGLGRRCSSRAQALRATGRLWHAWAMEAVLSTRASHQSRGSTGWTREGQNKAGMPGWARERGSEGARARGLGAADRCGGSLIRLRVAGLVLAAHTLSSRHAGSTKKPSCVLVGRSEGADERGAGIHCTRTTATTTTTTTTTTDCTTALAPPPLAPSPPPSPPPPPTPLGPDAAAGSQAPPALAYLKPRRARVKPRLAPLDWLRGPVARIGTGRGSSQVVLRK